MGLAKHVQGVPSGFHKVEGGQTMDIHEGQRGCSSVDNGIPNVSADAVVDLSSHVCVFGSCGCCLFWFSVSTRLGARYICIWS